MGDVVQFYMLYLSVSPADDTYRVRLRPGPVPGSNYINSSFVDVRAHCFKVHEHSIEI